MTDINSPRGTNSASPITQVSKDDVKIQPIYSSKPQKKRTWFNLFKCCMTVPDEVSTSNYSSRGLPPGLTTDFLLSELKAEDFGKKTLVLDLDETLVHSSFKPITNADFIIPVEIEDQIHQVYVVKRPGVDKFMKFVGEKFEIVVFTASLSKYADPVLDLLDIHKVVKTRLFREACVEHKGNFVKDLSKLGRDMKSIVIIDNSPMSYLFHPDHAIAIGSWFDDPNDTELLDMMNFLGELSQCDDVVVFLEKNRKT